MENRDQDLLEEMLELVIFTMANGCYAFEGSMVREIVPHVPITVVPGSPREIRGIINVRGVIESVLNLHTLLGVEEQPVSSRTRFVLARSKDLMSGIQVDSVEDVISIEKKRIKPVISTISTAVRTYADGGEVFYKEQYVIVLSVEKLFSMLLK